MDIRRVILGVLLAVVAYGLWDAWSHDYPKTMDTHVAYSKNDARKSSALLPTIHAPDEKIVQTPPGEVATAKTTSQAISVKTDVLDLKINLKHGDIVSAELLGYPETIDSNKPFVLLGDGANQRYVANSNLLIVDNGQVESIDAPFTAGAATYVLNPHQDELKVTLTGQAKQNLQIKKVFVFKRGSYLINVHYELDNQGSTNWTGYLNTQLVRTLPKDGKSTPFRIGSYTGASYSSPGHHRFQKVSFKDMNKSPLDVTVQGGWLAMQQHYFLTAWIPPNNATTKFYSSVSNGDYAIGSVSEPIKLSPSHTKTLSSKLYLGPEVADTLKLIAPGLDLTIDYGWLWFISSLLFSVMKLIYSVVGNWGWAIVLVTVLIKLAFYRLSATSYRSMANMRRLQPKLQALRERFGDDKAKMSQETMALYREEKVNPLSGCLPLLIQIPVFIALYWVLVESVELRQAPFVFWIKDLALPDPYHVLPLVMGATMFIQQKLNPTPPDPMQAKLMMFLPVLFTGLFWNFPSGLVLYWTVNNTLTILQQWYITRKIEAKS